MHYFIIRAKANQTKISTSVVFKAKVRIEDIVVDTDDYILKDKTHRMVEDEKGFEVYLISTTTGVYFLSSKGSYIVGMPPMFKDESHPLLHMLYMFCHRNYQLIVSTSTNSHNDLYRKLTRLYRKYLNADYTYYVPCMARFGSLLELERPNGDTLVIGQIHGVEYTLENIRLVYDDVCSKYVANHRGNYERIIMPFARTILTGVNKINKKLRGVKK
jgi:hypothetical protein